MDSGVYFSLIFSEFGIEFDALKQLVVITVGCNDYFFICFSKITINAQHLFITNGDMVRFSCVYVLVLGETWYLSFFFHSFYFESVTGVGSKSFEDKVDWNSLDYLFFLGFLASVLFAFEIWINIRWYCCSLGFVLVDVNDHSLLTTFSLVGLTTFVLIFEYSSNFKLSRMNRDLKLWFF